MNPDSDSDSSLRWDELPANTKQNLIELAEDIDDHKKGISRRDVLAGSGALGIGAILGGAGTTALTEPALASHGGGTGEIGTKSNPIDHLWVDSTDTEQLSNIRIIDTDNTVSDINNALGDAGTTVIITEGNYALSDRILYGANNTHLIIQSGATVKIADTATPTTYTDNNGNTLTPLIYADGLDSIALTVRGVLDANEQNFTNTDAALWRNVTDGELDLAGSNVANCREGYALVDCQNTNGRGFHTDDFVGTGRQSVITLEGCDDCTVEKVRGYGIPELVDFNGYNENCTARDLKGDWTGEAADVNGSPGTTVEDVEPSGTPDNLVVISGEGDPNQSSKTDPGNCNDVTVSDVHGTTTGVSIACNTPGSSPTNPMKNLTLTGIRATSTGDHALRMVGGVSGQWDGLHVDGRFRSEAASSQGMRLLGEAGEMSENIHLDVTVSSSQQDAAVIGDCRGLTGEVRVREAGNDGIWIYSTTGGEVDRTDLTIVVDGTANNNVHVAASISGGVTLRGSSLNAVGNDVNVTSSVDGLRLDMEYGTLNNNGTNVTAASYAAV